MSSSQCILGVCATLVGLTLGLAGPASAQGQQTVPPSTNPAHRVVYPSEGQATEQQMSDQLECYNWAKSGTEWDPHQAYAQLEQTYGDAMQQFAQAQGGAVRGAAGGALAGLAIGAIAGDAGKGAAIGAVAGGVAGGARARGRQQQAQAEFEAAINEFADAFRYWDRHWMACMNGRNYSVY
jgi:hypothetical protein